MIDVLLVSPRLPAGHPLYGGDNAYTDMLLEHPPPGVRYHHYEELIASGQVRQLKWLYRIGPRLVKWGILPPDLWAEYMVSDFVPDLLHICGFSAVVRFPRHSVCPPVLLATSTGSTSDLRFYLGWDDARVRGARRLKRAYLRLIDAHDTSLRPEHAAKIVVWSEYARRLHLEEGFVRADQIEVLYPGLPVIEGVPKAPHHSESVTFLFIGRDYVRKNGDLVLRAFRTVREHCPRTELILVSQLADGRRLSEHGVVHHPSLTRRDLFEKVYPKADVLVLPSRAEGFGLVLLEAMAFGLPVIAVNCWAMLEIVQDGVNGHLIAPDSLDDLVKCMSRLATDTQHLHLLSQGARATLRDRFALQAHNDRLRHLYEEALASSHR